MSRGWRPTGCRGCWDHRRGIRSDRHENSNLQYRLQHHDRDDCWEEACDGELGYCVKYVQDDTERLRLEKELRWKFAPPCGSDAWDQPGTAGWEQTEELEQAYALQGAAEVDFETSQ